MAEESKILSYSCAVKKVILNFKLKKRSNRPLTNAI